MFPFFQKKKIGLVFSLKSIRLENVHLSQMFTIVLQRPMAFSELLVPVWLGKMVALGSLDNSG